MFKLFKFQCKYISKSLLYFCFILVVITFYIGFYFEPAEFRIGIINSGNQKPEYIDDIYKYYDEHNKYPYGSDNSEFTEKQIPIVYEQLWIQYNNNNFFTYTFGFKKVVKLDQSDLSIIEDILTEIGGKDIDTINDLMHGENKNQFLRSIKFNIDNFSDLMGKVDKILGGKSNFEKQNLKNVGGGRPLIYDEAVKEYDDLLNKDNLLGAFARLFCYSTSITAGLFSAFIVVFFLLKDKKNLCTEVIYSKSIKSWKLILCDFFSLITMIMIPYFILAIFSTITLIPTARNLSVSIDYFIFLKYTITWTMPTVLIVCSLTMLLTLLFNSQSVIILQPIWWLKTMNMDVNYFGIKKFFFRYTNYLSRTTLDCNLHTIIINRCFYTVLSIICLLISIYVFSIRRKGLIGFELKDKKIFKNNLHKFKNHTVS